MPFSSEAHSHPKVQPIKIRKYKPFTSNSTAAIQRNLKPLSLSFLMRTLIALMTLLEVVNAAFFSANNSRYMLIPNPNGPRAYQAVMGLVYKQLSLGDCGAKTEMPDLNFTYGGAVVAAPGAIIYKENFIYTLTDQCLKTLVLSIVKLVEDSNFTLPDPYSNPDLGTQIYDRNTKIIYGTIFPMIGLVLIIAGGYFGYKKYKERNAEPVVFDVPEPDVEAPAPVVAPAQVELPKAEIEQKKVQGPAL